MAFSKKTIYEKNQINFFKKINSIIRGQNFLDIEAIDISNLEKMAFEEKIAFSRSHLALLEKEILFAYEILREKCKKLFRFNLKDRYIRALFKQHPFKNQYSIIS